jgi:hypothetical protein
VTTGYHPDLIELQLAHAERNRVQAAYNKAQRLPERRKMMQAWADYLDGPGRPGWSLRQGQHSRFDAVTMSIIRMCSNSLLSHTFRYSDLRNSIIAP